MKNIIDYQITSSASEQSFTLMVKELMKKGWQPYYGLIIKEEDRPGSPKNTWFYQAMVKYEE
jgi:hypothetical protein